MRVLGTAASAATLVAVLACSTDYAAEAPSLDGGVPNGALDGAGGGTSSGAPSGPPACDSERDPSCLSPPPGWKLVAIADVPEAGALPDCPGGLDLATELGDAPVPRAGACECAACTVTAQATCAGRIPNWFGGNPGCNTPDLLTYSNSPPGQCGRDLFQGTFADYTRYSPPTATGGSCSTGATKKAGEVDWSNHLRVCEATSRCSGGVCDANVPAPFRACVANAEAAGDATCPSSFPNKRSGFGAIDFDCACTCNVVRGTCTGTITHYPQNDCTGDAKTDPLNDACHLTDLRGSMWRSYKVNATSQTTCTNAAIPPPANVQPIKPRTICCR